MLAWLARARREGCLVPGKISGTAGTSAVVCPPMPLNLHVKDPGLRARPDAFLLDPSYGYVGGSWCLSSNLPTDAVRSGAPKVSCS